MKTKKFDKKLTLNKKTVTNMSDWEMNQQRGGISLAICTEDWGAGQTSCIGEACMPTGSPCPI